VEPDGISAFKGLYWVNEEFYQLKRIYIPADNQRVPAQGVESA